MWSQFHSPLVQSFAIMPLAVARGTAGAACAVGASATAQAAAPVNTVATRKDLFIAFRLSFAGPAIRGHYCGELSVRHRHGTNVEGTLNLGGPGGAGWSRGIPPRGYHRTERESLPSLRSSHPWPGGSWGIQALWWRVQDAAPPELAEPGQMTGCCPLGPSPYLGAAEHCRPR